MTEIGFLIVTGYTHAFTAHDAKALDKVMVNVYLKGASEPIARDVEILPAALGLYGTPQIGERRLIQV